MGGGSSKSSNSARTPSKPPVTSNRPRHDQLLTLMKVPTKPSGHMKVKTSNLALCQACGGITAEADKVDFGCIHIFCKSCVKKAFTYRINEENLPLKCLNPTCNVPALRILIQRVVDKPDFARYQLICQRNVPKSEKKSCPLCKMEALSEPEHFYGLCEGCNFTFCTNCDEAYHGFDGGCQETRLKEDSDSDNQDENEYMIRILAHLQEMINTEKAGREVETGITGIRSGTEFECNICFLTHQVSAGIHFGCDHQFCLGCIKSYFETKVNDRISHGFKCPAVGCEIEADHGMIKRVLDPNTFEKYDEILLNDTIAREMPEIVTCPKVNCQRRVIAEPEYGYCVFCDFRFCTECSRAFHGLTLCGLTEAERLAEIRRINASDEAQRIELERQLEQQRKTQNAACDTLIRTVCKKCPSCKTNIEKNHGCNHMQCIKCGTHFCWVCLEKLDRDDQYDHYNREGTKCMLFLDPGPG